jgi:hypothetical protein
MFSQDAEAALNCIGNGACLASYGVTFGCLCVLGRGHVQTNEVFELRDEPGSALHLETLDPLRLQAARRSAQSDLPLASSPPKPI